jgi:hypothetical protein
MNYYKKRAMPEDCHFGGELFWPRLQGFELQCANSARGGPLEGFI